jgi:hypothetical protein
MKGPKPTACSSGRHLVHTRLFLRCRLSSKKVSTIRARVSFVSLIMELDLVTSSSTSADGSGIFDFLPLVHFSSCVDGNAHAQPTVVG